jgi:hydrogenase expression/formation protein HypC
MCLAVPVKIVEIEGNRATVDFAGNRRSAGLMLVPEAKVGDYVLLHAGFAITVLDEADALESLKLLGIEVDGDGTPNEPA